MTIVQYVSYSMRRVCTQKFKSLLKYMNGLVEWACFECGMRKKVKFNLCRSSSPYYLSWYDDTTLPEKRVFYDLYNGLYGYIYRNVIVSASYLNNKEKYIIDLSKVINDDKYWLYT